MSNIKILGSVFLMVAVAILIRVELYGKQRPASSPNTILAGTVKSADGKPMEGVAVSARAQGKTYTTSVYTDKNGDYFFPVLDGGQYGIWAQAVGFEAGRATLDLAAGKRVQQNFALQTLADFSKQLSATEWMDSLPENTPTERRMNAVLNNNCGNCHLTSFFLQNRFDFVGWGLILSRMEKRSIAAQIIGASAAANQPMVHAYKEELVAYLTQIRGPNSPPLNYKPMPRPTGEATQVVVTEYDIPPANAPAGWVNGRHDGSDWSEGAQAGCHGGGSPHDTVIDKEGNVWFSDSSGPDRTIGKLDPRTGRVTSYVLPDKDGLAVGTHSVAFAPDGNLWLTNTTEGTITKFDPKTEKFQRFPRQIIFPPNYDAAVHRMGINDSTIDVDSKGHVWATTVWGVLELNPKTGVYTEHNSVTPEGQPYGIAVDSEDNVWFAQPGNDRIDVVEAKTGKVSEVVLPPLPLDMEITEKDRSLAKSIVAEPSNATPLQRGPRRMGADRKGDTVWIGETLSGYLSKIDIHTRKVTEYLFPHRYSRPYSAAVDKNHMVWISMFSSDQIAKFDPKTEKFTEYPWPTRTTGNRHVQADDSTDPPTIWVPYVFTCKIARMQFRTGSTTR